MAALRSSAAPGELEVIETHMSWVYLLGDEVFKLKKPVRHAFLDFTQLDYREAFCREEVRLNARLAPGIYLGLVALQHVDGQPSLVDGSEIRRHDDTMDWLVHMRRLPRARMLDEAMANRTVLTGDVDSLIRVLANFYRQAVPTPVSPMQYVDRLQQDLRLSSRMLLDPRWETPDAAQTLLQLRAALDQHQAALGRRALSGRIVDGHGDLRPEHVCLLHPPVVIDCIEFSAQLRQVDPFDELAFLSLECRMAGAGWIGERLISGCARLLGDRPSRAVLQLYTAHRALVRARLSLAHLLDPLPRTPERWEPQARRYVKQAQLALGGLALNEPTAPPEAAHIAQ
jgi:aminoglycoside phosphotransferase family enzyme